MCSASQEIRVTWFAQPTINPLACCICWTGLLGRAVFPPWNEGPNFGFYTSSIKTDNGPAYISRHFKQFLPSFSIKHFTGIPYNPQAQDTVEQTHHTLKLQIEKIKEGGIHRYTTVFLI